jgi:hypothetical protein
VRGRVRVRGVRPSASSPSPKAHARRVSQTRVYAAPSVLERVPSGEGQGHELPLSMEGEEDLAVLQRVPLPPPPRDSDPPRSLEVNSARETMARVRSLTAEGGDEEELILTPSPSP